MAAWRFNIVRLSLADLLGEEYVDAVAEARSALEGRRACELRRLARRKVDFFPAAMQRRLVALLERVGRPIRRALPSSPEGAGTTMFRRASRTAQAPLSTWACFRVGEDGLLRFGLKSAHYHAPLGHGFPGFALLAAARALGMPNATHNNTRGWITRRLEEELVRTANGLGEAQRGALQRKLRSSRGRLNRVLNLQTGSLACEAAIKMMLARFCRVQPDSPTPLYAGRTPVLVVLGDDAGGPSANYHGTCMAAQCLRGMWPDLSAALERHGVWRVAVVRPNDTAGLEAAFARCEGPPLKIAGLLHELVMMNYGGRTLTRPFVRETYRLCRRHDVPVLCDEIQSGLWHPQLYMFREYGVRPNFLAVGKGFPAGEYAASRLVFDAGLDCLPQFGALVTNGQEELASLAYLVTMRWAAENAEKTAAVGQAYEGGLRELANRYPAVLSGVEGRRHLMGLRFHDVATAAAFAQRLVAGGLDISVQTYKTNVPPAALTKLPLIAGMEAVHMVVGRMSEALSALGKGAARPARRARRRSARQEAPGNG